MGAEHRLLDQRKATREAVAFHSIEPMEKLVIYNGSPRRSGSNSALILKNIIETLGDRVENRDLKDGDKWKKWNDSFIREEHVISSCPCMYMQCLPTLWNLLRNFKSSEEVYVFLYNLDFQKVVSLTILRHILNN